MVKHKVFSVKTKDAKESLETTYLELRLRALSELNNEIKDENIISISENTWETEVTPLMCDSSTWYKSKNLSLSVFYTDIDNESEKKYKLELLQAKLALFKMINQFMYSGTMDDGTEYFDDYCESAGEAAFSILKFKDDRISKEEFYREYDKLLGEISKINGCEKDWSFLEWYIEDKKERDEHRKNNILFTATEMNWGEICSNSGVWLSTHYTINKNGRFNIVKSFDGNKGEKASACEYELEYYGNLSDEDLELLNKLLTNFDKCKSVEACDGIGWKMVSYAKDTEERFEGYTYGDENLIEIVRMLHSLHV